MKKREELKYFLDLIANYMPLFVECIWFAFVWFRFYSRGIVSSDFSAGNGIAIVLYGLVVFLFNKILDGYEISYMRVWDIILSNICAVVLSGVIVQLQICMIVGGFVTVYPVVFMVSWEIVFILLWYLGVRRLYRAIFPPSKLLVIYGEYSPENLMKKIMRRKDKYNVCDMIRCNIEFECLCEEMCKYEAVVLCDLPADTRNKIMKFCYEEMISVYVTPKISDILLASAVDMHIFDMSLLLCKNRRFSMRSRIEKRIFDIIFSVLAILMLSPFILLISVCVKLHDKGPVFYTQKRLTRDGKEFNIIKFRSMELDSERDGARLASKVDSRITPVGMVLRRFHLDELPQLFNILKGDMSFVGPRPERPEFHEMYTEKIPEFPFRLKVKAGLTGYAQVYGQYTTTPYDKLKLDITYIERHSMWLDFKLLILTIKILFLKENSEGVDIEKDTVDYHEK